MAQSGNNSSHNKGTVLRVSGTIIDVQFPRESAPHILNELLVEFPHDTGKKPASIEVAQQLGDGVVRCIAIDNIFTISRGLPVIGPGNPPSRLRVWELTICLLSSYVILDRFCPRSAAGRMRPAHAAQQNPRPAKHSGVKGQLTFRGYDQVFPGFTFSPT